MENNTKQITKTNKELKELGRKVGLTIISDVIPYAKNIERINNIANTFNGIMENEKESVADRAKCGSVALHSSKTIKDAYHELMGFEAKHPQQEDNLDQFSEEELEQMLYKAEKEIPIEV